METKIVNIKTDDFDCYIGRPNLIGNPYKIGKDGNRDQVIAKYRRYFNFMMKTSVVFKEDIENLRGKRLGCYCRPLACHGDVIVEYLEGKNEQNKD